MTRLFKERTQLAAFGIAYVFCTAAKVPAEAGFGDAGVALQARTPLLVAVSVLAAGAAVGLVYLVEGRLFDDPCVRRHRFWDMGEIVLFMAVRECLSESLSGTSLWIRLTALLFGMAVVFFGRVALQRRLGCVH